MTSVNRAWRRFFPRRKRPLEMWRLAWKSHLGVKILALGLDATTSKGGRYGL